MGWRTTASGVVLAALTASFATGCADSSTESGAAPESGDAAKESTTGQGLRSTMDAIAERGELRVCSTGDYRPFTYRDANGAWSGIDIDMARDLAAELGVRATIVATTWESLSEDFAQRCDIAAGGVSVTLKRAKEAFFSDAYVVDGKTPITRCENAARFLTLEQIDRPGVRAVVNPGGTNEKFAREKLHRAEIVPHPDNNTIFEEIRSGRADLMITDGAETKWQARQHPELCAVHPDQPFTFSEKAYLLPRGDVVFQQFVNEWLHLRKHDGTYDRIARPWIG
ncbi:transporter substrate-binding domain-containing protein [Saccharopolyspora sp. NFXS83]|uniref:transporter substrate-binding domain-containing protein n=1 Tax=Saccharopolyspora sp. NFXS83 TaxID=2993560 RepID=UPI00224B8465|nr:transporter substrate-binding domain-containing protein [Saccharopolyspora sp. NFXS83]MCX2731848.1 transporter substrate-binding domain-containing protein [Saccharopolyspora sp. NFXS83]